MVLWKREDPLYTDALRGSPDWDEAYRDAEWVVLCRADATIGC